jgi:NADPH:quinone reductase-like Zn-dependent oxidoreductase
LAKFYGAEVTAVDSTGKLEMLRAIGADHVIDYTQENFFISGEKYDVIFDMVYGSSFSRCIVSVTPEGSYLMANPDPLRMIRSLWVSLISKKKVIFEFAPGRVEDLEHVGDLIVSGKIKPAIDRRYPLENLAAAHDYVEKGYKKGCVVITVTHSDQ